MNQLKPYFVTPYLMVVFLTFLHSCYELFSSGFTSAWLGAVIALAPAVVFFLSVFLAGRARTSANLPTLWIGALIGSGVALMLPGSSLPKIYALAIGLLGSLLYVFWYSRFGDRSNQQLVEGNTLPDFVLHDADGGEISAAQIRQQPALLLFFRGNWCPLCMAQIGEIAEQYKELDRRGVKVYLVSPQSEENTQTLANRFEVPMNFLIDHGSQVARQLGIIHEQGLPVGVSGYDKDTIMPTALLTDEGGKILFVDLTDNYRVRPEPETFLKLFDQHGVAVA